MERFEQQFKKGILEMLVLKLVAMQKAYGYDLILQLRAFSGGLIDLKEGTLYPILYRLEDEGYIRSARGAGGGRREKKYYEATPAGQALLRALGDYWTVFSQHVDAIMRREANHEQG